MATQCARERRRWCILRVAQSLSQGVESLNRWLAAVSNTRAWRPGRSHASVLDASVHSHRIETRSPATAMPCPPRWPRKVRTIRERGSPWTSRHGRYDGLSVAERDRRPRSVSACSEAKGRALDRMAPGPPPLRSVEFGLFSQPPDPCSNPPRERLASPVDLRFEPILHALFGRRIEAIHV